ncbi:hypothetical protein K438DRAFT_2008267 [Mycena galopus ATCC 62051]|nr:hypothetical protein K438DRAFT_2008267 [Mycena galopus ATCC 62051]
MSDKVREFVEIPQQFVRDGSQFLTRCTKPSEKGSFVQALFAPAHPVLEFSQICKAVGVGFAVMGFIGYFVKLIHIPINNILVYVKRSFPRHLLKVSTVEGHSWVEAATNCLYFKITVESTSAAIIAGSNESTGHPPSVVGQMGVL